MMYEKRTKIMTFHFRLTKTKKRYTPDTQHHTLQIVPLDK